MNKKIVGILIAVILLAGSLTVTIGFTRVYKPPSTHKAKDTRPFVSASADVTVGKSPLTVFFHGESYDPDGDSLSCLWDFGDGQYSSSKSVKHVYEKVGEYTAVFSVEDQDGYLEQKKINISVRKNAKPTAVISASSFSGRWPFKATFSAEESYDTDGEIVSYKWNFGGTKIFEKVNDEDIEINLTFILPNDPLFLLLGLYGLTADNISDLLSYVGDIYFGLCLVYDHNVPNYVELTVTDDDGATDTVRKEIYVKTPIMTTLATIGTIRILILYTKWFFEIINSSNSHHLNAGFSSFKSVIEDINHPS